MLPDRVSNPGPLTYESGALQIALRSPALLLDGFFSPKCNPKNLNLFYINKTDLDFLYCFGRIF